MNLSRDPVHLNADNVTLADCAQHGLTVMAGCGPCRLLRGMLPARVGPPMNQRPLMTLFLARKLRCQTCKSPSNSLSVTFEGNSITPKRVILNIVES